MQCQNFRQPRIETEDAPLKTLVAPQVAPLRGWQLAQYYVSDAHALESGDLESDEFAHAADLALLALAQYEAQLIPVLPAHFGALERRAVKAQAKIQLCQAACRKPALDAHQGFLFDSGILADQLLRNAT